VNMALTLALDSATYVLRILIALNKRTIFQVLNFKATTILDYNIFKVLTVMTRHRTFYFG
jgi:hypothetical protein